MAKLFLSTPSARRATRLCHNLAQLRGFLSTPSARRATHLSAVSRLSHPNFYPRPPRGGRPTAAAPSTSAAYFYPRPPRGGRLSSWSSDLADIIFLSTPSARRATPQAVRGHGGHQISIHALREEGDDAIGERQDVKRLISIHALREEGDPIQFDLHNCKDDFYPRPPRGGRLLPPHPADRA